MPAGRPLLPESVKRQTKIRRLRRLLAVLTAQAKADVAAEKRPVATADRSVRQAR